MKHKKNYILLTLGSLLASTSGLAQNSGGGQDSLLIWINADKAVAGLTEIAKRFEEDYGVPVRVEAPQSLTDRFQQAAQSGAGPDILFWAHDRLGEWAIGGLLAPIEVDADFKEQYFDLGWEAFTHQGRLYGYPVAFEVVSLIYNKALLPDSPPDQLSEIAAVHRELQQQGQNLRSIIWDYNNTFFTWGLLASGGANVFEQTVDGGYDITRTGVNAPSAVTALDELVGLINDGVIPRGATYSVMEARMIAGELAMMITGPWAWSNLREANIDFGLAPIPGIDGNPGRPFVGVLGAMINQASPNQFLAKEFMEHYLLTAEGMETLNDDVAIGVPSNKAFYETLAAGDERIRQSMVNVENGALMPSVPEMGRFWSAMAAALEQATSGQSSAQKALDDAANNITSGTTTPFKH